MPAIIQCPFCAQQYTVADEQFGAYVNSSVTCTSCNRTFSVIHDGSALKALAPAQAAPPPVPVAQPINYMPPAPTGRINGWAIAGLACGVCGIFTCGLGSLLGIIFSIIGLRRASSTGTGKGLAIAGLIVSALFVLVLPGILLPSLARAREKANQVKCAANIRSIGMAAQLYAQDYIRMGSIYPPSLDALLKEQTLPRGTLDCPSDSSAGTGQVTGGRCSYVWLGQGLRISSSPDAVLAYEPISNHKGEGGNFLFCDGHVEFIGAKDATRMIQQLQQGADPPGLSGPETQGSSSRP